MEIFLTVVFILPAVISYFIIYRYIEYELYYSLKYIKQACLLLFPLSFLIQFPLNVVPLISFYFLLRGKYIYSIILLSFLPLFEPNQILIVTIISLNALIGILWRKRESLM